MYRALIKSFVSTWYHCLHPKGLGGSWLPEFVDAIAPQRRWNKIPSIIPTSLPSDEIGPRRESEDVSDQDDDEMGSSTEQGSEDVDDEFRDFINILAYS
jgi:hypothetical protein